MSSAATEYVYTITGAAPVVTPDPEEPGEGGGEATGAVTYVGANGDNSRGMQVIIDIAADTMTITRASSSSLDNFAGQTSYVYSYSATVAAVASGSAISTIAGGYSAISSIAFDANGLVTKVVWNSMEYMNFVQQ